jgi:hypothetical protein
MHEHHFSTVTRTAVREAEAVHLDGVHGLDGTPVMTAAGPETRLLDEDVSLA